MAKSIGVKPPQFSGKSDEDADSFVKAFERYIKYRETNDDTKKLNLFAVLLLDAAADWFDLLADDDKSTLAKLNESFAKRYIALQSRCSTACKWPVYEKTGRIEASFASKLVATINPRMPVVDRIVLKNLYWRLPYVYKQWKHLKIIKINKKLTVC